MGKIEKWVANQLPDISSQLEVVNGVDFLHISVDAKIKKMRPRIGISMRRGTPERPSSAVSEIWPPSAIVFPD